MKATIRVLGLVALVITSICRAGDSTDEVVVTVNGEPILHRQVVAEADARINANIVRDANRGLIFQESAREDLRASLREDVLNTLIERQLIMQQLKMDRLEITDAEVEAAFQKRIAGMGQTQVEAETEIAEQGKTPALVKERLRWHTVGIEKLYECHVANKKSLSETEARQMYTDYPREFDRPEQRRVSHILIRVAPEAKESDHQAARQKAEALLKRLRSGEDFTALARQYSDDDASKLRGGDRGYSTRGVVFRPEDDPFGTAAFALKKVGDLSEVVASSDGLHIILLTGLKPARRLSWEEARDFLIADFRHREIGAFWEHYGGKLRADAKIVWMPGELTRHTETQRRQEKINAQVEAMIAQEQTKVQQ